MYIISAISARNFRRGRILQVAMAVVVGKDILDLRRAIESKEYSREVQAFLDCCTGHEVVEMSEALVGCVRSCTLSLHANFVVQKFIELMPPHDFQFIIDELIDGNVMAVAKHNTGCRVMERLIGHSHDEQLDMILDAISDRVAELSIHKYGNFVVQHILEHGRTAHIDKITTCYLRSAQLWLPTTRTSTVRKCRLWCLEPFLQVFDEHKKYEICHILLKVFDQPTTPVQAIAQGWITRLATKYCSPTSITQFIDHNLLGAAILDNIGCDFNVMTICVNSGWLDSDFSFLLRKRGSCSRPIPYELRI